MTDEVNWSDACRRVAEWMGELNHVYGEPHFEDDEGNVYLDYTEDDAAAWRLLIALHAKVDPPLPSGAGGTYRVEVWRDCKLLAMSEHESLAKSCVLAASELFGGNHAGGCDEQ